MKNKKYQKRRKLQRNNLQLKVNQSLHKKQMRRKQQKKKLKLKRDNKKE